MQNLPAGSFRSAVRPVQQSIVNADRVLSLAIALERLKATAGRMEALGTLTGTLENTHSKSDVNLPFACNSSVNLRPIWLRINRTSGLVRLMSEGGYWRFWVWLTPRSPMNSVS